MRSVCVDVVVHVCSVVVVVLSLTYMQCAFSKRDENIISSSLIIPIYLFENESAASATKSAGLSRKEAIRVSYPSL